jgi:hypothetical protein
MYFVLQYNTKVRLGRGFSLTELKVSFWTMLITCAIEHATVYYSGLHIILLNSLLHFCKSTPRIMQRIALDFAVEIRARVYALRTFATGIQYSCR